MADADEDDYMNMIFQDTEPVAPSTSLQRKQQSLKETEQRAVQKTKKEHEADMEAQRKAALTTALDPSNKGARMLAKLGYKGGALGKAEHARMQPIAVEMREDRSGIGRESDKKRKLREQMDEFHNREKRTKMTEDGFRERNMREREEKRQTGIMWGAMRVVESFDTEAAEEKKHEEAAAAKGSASPDHANPARKPARVNVLWRTLANERADRSKKQKPAHLLPDSDDSDEDADDRIALGSEIEVIDDEDEDMELEEFMALPVAERVSRIVGYLRDTYHYCFWCKFRYPDADMEGCPGITEEEHD